MTFIRIQLLSSQWHILIAVSCLINAVFSTYNYTIYTANGCYGGMMTIDCGGRLKISIIREIYGRHPEEKCFPSPSGNDCGVDGDFYKNLCNYQSRCQHFGVGWKYINRTGCRDLYTNYVHLVYACYSDSVPRVPLNQPCYERDICDGGPSSECLQGYCRCRDGYFESSRVCVAYGRKKLGESCSDQDTCIDDHSECYKNTCDCQTNYVNRNGKCVLQGSSDFCSTNNDCSTSNMACINGLCSCRVGYILRNGTCVESTLDSSARPLTSSTTPEMLQELTPGQPQSPWLNQCPSTQGLCRDRNSLCINGTCVCHSSFYFSNNSCKPRGELNSPCLFGLCVDPNGYCAEQGICRCREAYYEKNRVCVHRLYLGQSCDSFDVCAGSNAQCLSQRCSCTTGFQEVNGHCDQAGSLGSPCLSSPQNGCTVPETVCQNGVCDCRPGFSRSSSTTEIGKCKLKILLGGSCSLDDVCADERASCLNGQCSCRSTHYNDNGRCVSNGILNAPCILAPTFGDGCLDTGLFCSAGFCHCRQEYYIINGSCGSRVPLGQQCESIAAVSNQCLDEASFCSSGRCTCRSGFTNVAGVCIQNVTHGAIFGSCTNLTSCFDVNSQCRRGICRCKEGFFYKSSSCVPRLSVDSTCSNGDVCSDANSICLSGKCQCMEDFVFDNATGICHAKGLLGRPCLRGNVCVTQHSNCSQSQCVCSENFFAKLGICVPRIRLWGTCLNGDSCQDSNSICYGGQCQCRENYFEKAGLCVSKISIDEVCAADDRCVDMNSDCVNGRCVCRMDFIKQITICKSREVRGGLFTDCSLDGDCSVSNSACVNNLCVCVASHFAAFGQCIPKIRLTERCDINRDVCDDVNSICQNGFCSCQSDYYESQQRCVSLGTFGAPCIFGSQCVTLNSQCVNGYCVCVSGHFYRNGICVPKISTGEKCDPQDSCFDTNAECTSTSLCQCLSGYAASYGRCVLLVPVGQSCFLDSICSDPNSLCINGFCQCIQGFQKTADNTCKVQSSSSGAVPGSLGGVCLTGNTCSSPQLICTVTGLCACASEYYSDQTQCVRKVALGGVCLDNFQCLDVNAFCDQGQCHCARFFVNYNNVCVISSNATMIACERDFNCPFQNAVCVRGFCSCLAGYRLLAGQCYNIRQIFPDINCFNDSVCSSTSKCIGYNCVCPSDFVARANVCQATVVLGGVCSIDDTCRDPNSVCRTSTGEVISSSSSTSGTCVCQTNFVIVAGLCVPQSSANDTRIPCLSASNCNYPRATCINGFCGCESSFRFIAGKCYRTIDLGAACQMGEVCIDDNSFCDETGVCSCQNNYRRESDKCVPIVGAASAFFGLDPALGIFLLVLAILAALLLLSLLLCCLVYCCRRCRRVQKDNYEGKLIETESANNSESNTLNKRSEGHVNTSYLATSNDNTSAKTTRRIQQQQQQQQQHQRFVNGSRSEEMMSAEHTAESYRLEDLPRVTRLNHEEIRSAEHADELDLVDLDSDGSLQYRFVNNRGGTPSYAVANHENNTRQHVTSSSTSNRRQMASSQFSHVSSAGSVSTPSTIHRNVSAFGEITVMPVGDEDENLRISVGEEII